MAKDKDKKKAGAKTAAAKPKTRTRPKPKTKRATVTKAVQGARKKAAQLAGNPAIAEIVAASLVAAAAAIKSPKKARAMAMAVGDELETASKQAAERGGAFWTMALDIARRSIDALGADSGPGKARAGGKAKPAAKAKPGSRAKPAAKAKTRSKAKPAAKAKTGSRAKAGGKSKTASRKKARK